MPEAWNWRPYPSRFERWRACECVTDGDAVTARAQLAAYDGGAQRPRRLMPVEREFLATFRAGLLQADAAGSNLSTVVVYIRPSNSEFGADPKTWPLRLTLAPVAVTSVEESADTAAASAPEIVTMATTKATFRYQPPNSDQPQTFSWNVVTNRPS
jgi:hypothetical protein